MAQFCSEKGNEKFLVRVSEVERVVKIVTVHREAAVHQ